MGGHADAGANCTASLLCYWRLALPAGDVSANVVSDLPCPPRRCGTPVAGGCEQTVPDQRPEAGQLRGLMAEIHARYHTSPEPAHRWFASLSLAAGPFLAGGHAAWVFRDAAGQRFGVVLPADETWPIWESTRTSCWSSTAALAPAPAASAG
jgi:hypothetical protein